MFFFVGHNMKYKAIFFKVKNASGRGDSGSRRTVMSLTYEWKTCFLFDGKVEE